MAWQKDDRQVTAWCASGKLTARDTKTAAGTRTIKLSPSTAALLRERKKTALTEWIFPHPWKPEQLPARALPMNG